jgi:hypothetical protein
MTLDFNVDIFVKPKPEIFIGFKLKRMAMTLYFNGYEKPKPESFIGLKKN